MTDNIPPFSEEAEKAVLGIALFSDNYETKELFDILRYDMFYFSAHQVIFKTMSEMRDRDLISVTEKLTDDGLIDDAGGFAYVADLGKGHFLKSQLMKYAEIIQDKYYKRSLIGIMNTGVESVYQGVESHSVIDSVKSQIQAIDMGSAYEPVNISTLAAGFMDRMEAKTKGDESAIGIKTGIKPLDDVIGGIGSDWLFVIAGRPSMGKTKIAQMITNNIARKKSAMFFSMEMSDEETFDRVIGIGAGVKPLNMRLGALTDYEWQRVSEVLRSIDENEFRMFLDVDSSLCAAQIRARVKAAKRKNPDLAAFVVDYVELMTLEKGERYDLMIALTVKKLKEIARDLKVPCILLAQANRGADEKNRPSMSNLYGSSALEKYADYIMFVHRDDVANPESVYKGITMLISAKSRHTDIARDIYMKQKPDENGGGVYYLDDSELGLLEHQNELKNEPKRYKVR